MAITIKDLPRIPDYVPGTSDHQYLQAAWQNGPLAMDRYGFVTAFPMRVMLQLLDDRWTRQIELEGMRVNGVSKGPMFDFVDNVMLFSNGDVHRRRRGPLARAFAHKLVAEMRPGVADRCERLVSGLVGSGQVDFLARISGPLPAQVIGEILGVPEADMPRLARHVYSAIRGLSLVPPEVMAEASEDMGRLSDLVSGLMQDRRGAGDGGLVADYLDRVEGSKMSAAEVHTQMTALVVAGSDTTRGALAATVSLLLQHPEQWRLLVEDPERWAGPAASEGLRYDPVIGSMPRITLEDRDVEGVSLPAGTLVTSSMLTALRDPEIYTDPDLFDITREDHPRLHPVFGAGPHRCLGEALARVELEEALKALARRAPHLRLDGTPARLRGYGAVRSVTPFFVSM